MKYNKCEERRGGEKSACTYTPKRRKCDSMMKEDEKKLVEFFFSLYLINECKEV